MFHSLLFSVTHRFRQGRTSGIHRIANHLRSQGWDIEVVDFGRFWSLDELKELARSRITDKTKFIGFSHLFSVWTATFEDFTIWLKQKYPNIVIISGNSGIPFFETENIDYYIAGYGEAALDHLLKYLFSNGEAPVLYPNPMGKKIIEATKSYPAHPMRDPMIKYQERDFIQPEEWLPIEFSRGCKFKCAFCNFPVLGVKGDYTRDSESAYIQMMDAYDRWGVKHYTVSDETFNDRVEKITKFADMVERLPWQPYFSGFIRADLMISRKEEREELARMGFFAHYYGIETFNQETAKIVGKGMHPEKIKEGLIECRKFFESKGSYRATISMIAGLPHESKESLDDTRKWLLENWRDQPVSSYVMEIPIDGKARASTISENYEKYGYKKIGEYNSQNSFLEHNILKISYNSIVWENEHMDTHYALAYVDEANRIFNTVDNFDLGELNVNDSGKMMTLEERMSLDQKGLKRAGETVKDFLRYYIDRKLSL